MPDNTGPAAQSGAPFSQNVFSFDFAALKGSEPLTGQRSGAPRNPKRTSVLGSKVRDAGARIWRFTAKRAGGLRKHRADAQAWTISFLFHALLLLVLSLFIKDRILEGISEISTTIISGNVEEVSQNLAFDAVNAQRLGGEVALDTANGANPEEMSTARAVALVPDHRPHQDVQRRVENGASAPAAPVLDELELPAADNLTGSVNTQGAATTENPGTVEGAIDRLTFEIAASLRENKTLVVWLFDASLSLKSRRETIADRFERVYEQLDALKVNSEQALKTAVASYGTNTDLLTPAPVDGIESLVDSVRNIKDDELGRENVFAALEKVSHLWQPFCAQSHRKMLVIIVTDERGDDFDRLEPAILYARRYGVRCYVVGNAAPFGRETENIRWTYPDGTTEDLPVDRGPETAALEALNLAFWGTNGSDPSRMASGFGPYALTRLCAETGGIFLIAEEKPGKHGFRLDHDLMRNYRPDYRTVREYQADLAKNKAKGALVEAAMRTAAEKAPIPQTGFRADNDGTLRRELTEAQKPAATLDYKLTEMQDILSRGEKHREKLTQPRWQASYDLAMGRVLAMRVRAFGYNMVLAEMKSSPKPFQNKESNFWQLVPAREIAGGASVKKLADRGTKYLQGVIDNHPGTPWAMLAERELSEPMGWAWKEKAIHIPQSGKSKDSKKKPLLLAEEQAKQAKQGKQNKSSDQPRQKPKL